jgi:hypothetical protein
MSKSANVAITLLAFLCVIHQSFQCSPPGPDWVPPTIAELTQKAPIVVRGYVVKKVGDMAISFNGCLNISHVYKGSAGIKSYICVSKFGPTSACLSNPAYGVEHLFFLNGDVNVGTMRLVTIQYTPQHKRSEKTRRMVLEMGNAVRFQ